MGAITDVYCFLLACLGAYVFWFLFLTIWGTCALVCMKNILSATRLGCLAPLLHNDDYYYDAGEWFCCVVVVLAWFLFWPIGLGVVIVMDLFRVILPLIAKGFVKLFELVPTINVTRD